MAVIRDTVLLPGFQYIAKQLEKGSLDGVIDSLDELIQGCVVPEAETVFKNIRDWFVLYQENESDARSFLEEMIYTPAQCGQCLICQQCQQIFLIELYEKFYSDSKFEDLKAGIKNNNYYVLERLPENLYRHLDAKTKVGEYYWEHCKNLRRTESFVNKFVVLKGMSSSTPAILNGAFNTQAYHGGGLYFNWSGFGIAIDPGYHFVENMHNVGLSILDIDAVVITHEHIDHTNDIRILDDLNYSLTDYLRDEKRNHTINWYLDGVTYELVKTLQKNGSGFSDRTNRIYKIMPKEQNIVWEEKGKEITQQQIDCISEQGIRIFEKGNSSITMKAGMTFHERDRGGSDSDKIHYLKHTFASAFELKGESVERKIFYSSDTCYRDSLGEYAKGADIVVANISSIYEGDLLKIEPKKTHLGYMGCFELLESMKETPPALFLISEFWNAKADIRFDITHYMKDEILRLQGKNFQKTKIIPTEIGMQADLIKLTMQCAVCRKFVDDFIIMRPAKGYSEIKCVCSNCYY